MSIPSNTNPKLAKMQKTASRKTTMAQRGTVFHALGCKSSRDFELFMLFPKDDTTGRDLCVGFCKRRATGKPEIRISDAPKGLFLRGARMTASGAFLWLGKFGMGKCRCFNSASLRTPGQALLRLVVSKLRSLGRPALADHRARGFAGLLGARGRGLLK
jgi:hypothetical protein